MFRKSKHLAGISLAAMGAGFVSTLFFPASTSALLLQGGFEGGLVGGLADWFAVTALFRHPLGIPIPHTALVLKNRTRITDQLVSMLENDWLNKQSILNKLKQLNITTIVLDRLQDEIQAEYTGRAIVAASQAIVRTIDLELLSELIETEVRSYLNELDLEVVVRRLISRCITNGYDEKAVDFVLHKAIVWVQQMDTRQKLGSMAIQALSNIELDGFLQFALKSFLNLINEEKLGSILQNLLSSGLQDLTKPESGNRSALISYVRNEFERLEMEPKLYAEIQKWRSAWLASRNLKSSVYAMLKQLRQKALQFIESDAYLQVYIVPLMQKGLTAVRNKPELMETMEHWVQQQIARFVEQNHGKIGNMVRENLNKLDDATLTELMEDKLGHDLQWIRVNGAVCGFLIGGMIEGIKLLMHM